MSRPWRNHILFASILQVLLGQIFYLVVDIDWPDFPSLPYDRDLISVSENIMYFYAQQLRESHP